jgi:hypothetical protein
MGAYRRSAKAGPIDNPTQPRRTHTSARAEPWILEETIHRCRTFRKILALSRVSARRRTRSLTPGPLLRLFQHAGRLGAGHYRLAGDRIG